MTEQRKLAAVMFTDIAGYTALMSRDEQKALALLQKNRELQKSLTEKHDGEFLKEMGDGTLLCFQSALDAVRCALEIQKSAKDDPDLKLRIGIHLGDIVFKEGDVFGDGVNVASRIEGLTKTGDICISEEVYRSVRNQPEINVVFLAERRLKNVDQPVKIFRIIESTTHVGEVKKPRRRSWLVSPIFWAGLIILLGMLGGILLFLPSSDIPFSERDWILITDFENLTGDEVFDRSLNTALTVSIQQSRHVNVFPRTRVRETLQRMQVEQADTLDEGLGSEIAVREDIKLLVVPAISRIGDVYSLSVRIMDPNSQAVLKTEISQAGNIDEVLNALDELAQKIRKDLGESLAAISKRNLRLPKATTASLVALKYYSEGERAWDAGNYPEAFTSWKAAVEKDSNFASAHASLGGYYYYNNDRPNGEIHFTKALSLMDRLTERERLWIQSLIEGWRGNHEEAIRVLKVYLAQYPNSSPVWGSLGKKYLQLRRCEEALEAYGKLLEINPKNAHAFINIATCYTIIGKQREAIPNYLKSFELQPEWMTSLNLNHEFGFAYVKLGEFQKAEEIFEKMLSEDEIHKAKGHRSHALLDMYLGKFTSAIDHLKEAILFNQVAKARLSEVRDRLYLAVAYKSKEMMTEVYSQLNAVIAIQKEVYVEPYWLLVTGKMFARLKNLQQADRLLHVISANLNEENRLDKAAFHILKGEIELARGNYSEAIGLFEIAYKVRADNYILESLAYGYFVSDDWDRALEKYEVLISDKSLGWEAQEYWIQAHYQLGKIYEEKGLQEKALEHYQRFTELWKDADKDVLELTDAQVRIDRLRGN